MKEAIQKTIGEVVSVLTTTSLAKIEADVAGFPGVKVTAYWCGLVLRIDVKGAKS